MHKILLTCFIAGTFFWTSCDKKESSSNHEAETALQGTWVRVDDAPGRQPADTLRFFRKDGKTCLHFIVLAPRALAGLLKQRSNTDLLMGNSVIMLLQVQARNFILLIALNG